MNESSSKRTVTLGSATLVGLGGIVGGGIMVLAGTAFAEAGPSAAVAFAINGVIAFMTAMSLAEIASKFPESGGAYTYAKKVLSVRAAFAVGWVLWFAYIVAGVLYALGFAAFAVEGFSQIYRLFGSAPPEWLSGRKTILGLGTLAVAAYGSLLVRKDVGGGQIATIGKIIVFLFLIASGLVMLFIKPLEEATQNLQPFFAGGSIGLISTMGFTFIALQGFDLISTIGGSVKDPETNIPKSMFVSLGTALGIYIPLLLIISAVGTNGETIKALAEKKGDTVFATAVENFLGPAGFWFVIVAAVLSTLSALHANLLAASKVAHTMAQDRTLPFVLGQEGKRGTPVMAIYASSLTLVAIMFMVTDLSSAGAAASLIFLLSFSLAHLMSYLARIRSHSPQEPTGYQTPWFPVIPIFGGVACLLLAIFQAISVPDAGAVAAIWLALGSILYISLFKTAAETADASAEAFDPNITALRGKSPLVLAPIANPSRALSIIDIANAMAPSHVARVLLLSIVERKKQEHSIPEEKLADAQTVVQKALTASFAKGQSPEALITSAPNPWQEIERVADTHRCECLLLGFGNKDEVEKFENQLEGLLGRLDSNIAIMNASPSWRLSQVKRILVPVGGRGEDHYLRARILASICRSNDREITFMTVHKDDISPQKEAESIKSIKELAEVKMGSRTAVITVKHSDPAQAILEEAEKHDLIVLGLRSVGWKRRVMGDVVLRITKGAPCATIMVARGRSILGASS